MASFIIINKKNYNIEFMTDNRNKAIKEADKLRKKGNECYINKHFSKAGHNHKAVIEYDKDYKFWVERESIKV